MNTKIEKVYRDLENLKKEKEADRLIEMARADAYHQGFISSLDWMMDMLRTDKTI